MKLVCGELHFRPSGQPKKLSQMGLKQFYYQDGRVKVNDAATRISNALDVSEVVPLTLTYGDVCFAVTREQGVFYSDPKGDWYVYNGVMHKKRLPLPRAYWSQLRQGILIDEVWHGSEPFKVVHDFWPSSEMSYLQKDLTISNEQSEVGLV